MTRITPTIYQLQGVTKDWTDSGSIFKVSIPDLKITQGEIVAVIGSTGCGKSTFLEMLAMTLIPTSAEHFFFHRQILPASTSARLGGLARTISLITHAENISVMWRKLVGFCHF